MNFLHRLQALLDPPLQAPATTSYPGQTAASGIEIEPTADDRAVFATLAVLADNPGVLTTDTPGLPMQSVVEQGWRL